LRGVTIIGYWLLGGLLGIILTLVINDDDLIVIIGLYYEHVEDTYHWTSLKK